MRESAIKDAIMRELRKRGYRPRRMPQSGLTGGGLPDILVLLKRPLGVACWLEVKQPGKKPTRLQEATIRDLIYDGARCAVVTSVAEALDAVCGFEVNRHDRTQIAFYERVKT